MTRHTISLRASVLAIAVLLPLAATAQNIAIVNGKAVPKARLELLLAMFCAVAAKGSKTAMARTLACREMVCRVMGLRVEEKKIVRNGRA